VTAGNGTVADLGVHPFAGRDGLALTYRETGDGRPLILLRGFTPPASTVEI